MGEGYKCSWNKFSGCLISHINHIHKFNPIIAATPIYVHINLLAMFAPVSKFETAYTTGKDIHLSQMPHSMARMTALVSNSPNAKAPTSSSLLPWPETLTYNLRIGFLLNQTLQDMHADGRRPGSHKPQNPTGRDFHFKVFKRGALVTAMRVTEPRMDGQTQTKSSKLIHIHTAVGNFIQFFHF